MAHGYHETLGLLDAESAKRQREFFEQLAARCGPQVAGTDLELINDAAKAALATGAPGLSESIKTAIVRSIVMNFIKAKRGEI